MLTEIDIDAAVARGIISEDQAIALRNFEAGRAQESLSMAEKFQIFGGLSDIMAAVGLAMVLVAMSDFLHGAKIFIILLIFPPLLLALYNRFSPKHKPCLALVCLISAIYFSLCTIPFYLDENYNISPNPILGIITGVIPALGCAWLFWKSCRFPPIPACMATICIFGAGGSMYADDQSNFPANVAFVIAAVMVLAIAIWWDLTDIRRETERSQIAFWLHCSAGFFLSRGAYGLITGHMVFDEDLTSGLVLQNAIPFSIVLASSVAISLILDRRSLIFGSIPPMIGFIANLENEMYGVFLAGAMLLLFTFFWSPWRRSLLRFLPVSIVAQLPRTNIIHYGQRPTRLH